MDWKGGLVEMLGLFLATLSLINGAFTHNGELGLIRLNNFFIDTFDFSIPFLEVIANNTSLLTITAMLGILLIFKGPTFFNLFKKIFFRG